MSLLDIVREEAIRQGLPDPELAVRVARQESGGNQSARSPAGAIGTMQLMPGTAKELGVNPHDAADNIRGGVMYLKQQLDRFGSPELALAAYNAGPNRVAKLGRVPRIKETQDYVSKIMGGQDGADIFGLGQTQAQGDGADIFGLDAPQQARAPQRAPQTPQAPQQAAAPQMAPQNAPINLSALIKPPEAPKEKSQALGFSEGLFKPVRNVLAAGQGMGIPEQVIGAVLDAIPGSPTRAMPGGILGLNARQQQAEQAMSKTRTPGGIGRFAGEVVGTAPTMFAGPLAAGAMSGGLLTDKKDAGGIAGDVAFGGVAGKLGDAAMRGVGGLIGPKLDDAVKFLAKEGVPMTPGQLAGGALKSVEDAMTGTPLLGDMIKGGQRRSVEGLNRAAVERSLRPLGLKLPKEIPTGHDAVAFAQDALSDAFTDVLPKLTLRTDKQFADALKTIDVSTLSAPAKARLKNILKVQVADRLGKGVTGEQFKAAESQLRTISSNFAKSGNYDDQTTGAILKDVLSEIREMAARQNPKDAATLRAINEGYANLVRVEKAAASANEGIFSVPQLRTAARQGGSRKGNARGTSLLQDLAEAGQKVLPSKVPDSGTASRLMVNTLLGGGGLAAAGAAPFINPLMAGPAVLGGLLAAPYTKTGQRVIQGLLTASRPKIVQQAGRLAVNSGRAVGVGAAIGVTDARKKRKD